MKSLLCSAIGSCLLGMAAAESIYNPSTSAVAIYNNKNFEKQVSQNREKGISVVQFYKGSGKYLFARLNQHLILEPNSARDRPQFEKFGIDNKKMLRIGAVNCDDFSAVCEKENIAEFPTYRVYPPFPAPVQNHINGETELNSDTLKKMSFKHIGNRVIDITS